MARHIFSVGQILQTNAMGLAGVRLCVAEQITGPASENGYILTFAHNGNRVPARYDERLLRLAA